jgi:hypothetical protein
MWKKIKFFLQLRDGIWSVPVAFFIYVLVGLLLGWLFGFGTGTYDPGFIHPLFLAVAVVFGTANSASITIYFALRGMHRYIWGYKDNEGKIINKSKEDFQILQPWQRIIVAFISLLFFVSCTLLVYLKLV